jgi:steroid 5-alpha reductase family enzyme
LRYQAIRQRNEPNFRIKSVYLVFVLQALLAWFISLPLSVATQSKNPLNNLDFIGIALWILGMSYQVIGDAQLAKFKSKPENKGKVLASGVWKYTRLPNYFGESVVWWGFYLMALGAGAPLWLVTSPLLINFLLVKVSGVPMWEQDIAERRPAYRDYILSTSAFIPRPPRRLSP